MAYVLPPLCQVEVVLQGFQGPDELQEFAIVGDERQEELTLFIRSIDPFDNDKELISIRVDSSSTRFELHRAGLYEFQLYVGMKVRLDYGCRVEVNPEKIGRVVLLAK